MLTETISHDTAPVISISDGSCKQDYPASAVEQLISLAKQANAQGIKIITATGDAGAAGVPAAGVRKAVERALLKLAAKLQIENSHRPKTVCVSFCDN